MKRRFLIVIILILMIFFCGCIDDGPPKTDHIKRSRNFIKSYINNPETIVFNNETVLDHMYSVEIYGSGTVLYEGNIKNFSYFIQAYYNNNIKDFNYVLKQLIIGET